MALAVRQCSNAAVPWVFEAMQKKAACRFTFRHVDWHVIHVMGLISSTTSLRLGEVKRTGRGAAAAAASGSGELASESPPSLPARTQALSPAVRASAASPPSLTRPLSQPLPAPAVAPRRPAGKSADDIKLDLIELHNLWNSDIDDESASAFYSAAIVSAVLQIIRKS